MGGEFPPFIYFLGLGGLLPLPFPDSFGVVLGAFTGLVLFSILICVFCFAYSICFSASA
jgi:hypothetical protein